MKQQAQKTMTVWGSLLVVVVSVVLNRHHMTAPAAPANDFYLSTYVVLVFSDGSGSNVVTQSENSLKPLASVSQESSSHITASLIHYYAD